MKKYWMGPVLAMAIAVVCAPGMSQTASKTTKASAANAPVAKTADGVPDFPGFGKRTNHQARENGPDIPSLAKSRR